MNSTETSRDILIVKGRMKSISMNLYGQFILFFNHEKKMERYDAVVSTYSDIYNLEPHASWSLYETTIAQAKWKGNSNQTITNSVVSHFSKYSEDQSRVEYLYEAIDGYDYDSVDIILFDILSRIITDKNIILETGIQEVSSTEIVETRSARDKSSENERSKKEQNENDKKNASIILPVKPILAPVKGRPIYEIKIGHKIMLNIIPNNDRSNYYIDLLNLRENDKVSPVAGKVVDIKVGPDKNDPVEILTEIGAGIYGKIIEDERQIKLRMYDPLVDKKSNESTSTDSDIPKTVSGTITMVLILIVLIGLLLTFIFVI